MVENIQVSITAEGLESIAKLIAIGVTEGVAATTNFKVGFFRLGNLGDATIFEGKKTYRDSCDEVYYMSYTKSEFDAEHTTTLDPNITGYVAVNSIEYIAPVAPDEIGSVEISCYITPGFTNSLGNDTFYCNEIMVFTGDGTANNPYRSFLWGIFPDITKDTEYGINFTITCEF